MTHSRYQTWRKSKKLESHKTMSLESRSRAWKMRIKNGKKMTCDHKIDQNYLDDVSNDLQKQQRPDIGLNQNQNQKRNKNKNHTHWASNSFRRGHNPWDGYVESGRVWVWRRERRSEQGRRWRARAAKNRKRIRPPSRNTRYLLNGGKTLTSKSEKRTVAGCFAASCSSAQCHYLFIYFSLGSILW